MLQYLALGDRRFGAHPMTPHTRLNWEFYAVVSGKCAPLLPESAALPLVEHHLWVFPPETAHGWRGERGAECRVVCFHFAFVPPLLEEVAREKRFLTCALTAGESRRLQSLAAELHPRFEHPTNFSHVHFYRALLELTLLALRDVPEQPLPEITRTVTFKAQAAIAYFMEHLAEAPKVEDVAANLHVSVSQLRRMFMLTFQESPQNTFKRLRLQQAMEMLSETNHKLETIAAQCGYATAGDLSRAFRKEFHISPDAWRRNDYRAVPGALFQQPWLGIENWAPKKPWQLIP